MICVRALRDSARFGEPGGGGGGGGGTKDERRREEKGDNEPKRINNATACNRRSTATVTDTRF